MKHLENKRNKQEVNHMKTGNKTKNKNNQLSGVLLRVAAVLVSVVLLSFTVSAQDFWKQLLSYNSFGKMAMIMVDETEVRTPASESTTGLMIAEETDLPAEIEAWMTNDFYFGNYHRMNELAVDKPLEIENWMTDADYFSSRYAADNDNDLKLEAWMCDARYFVN